MYRADDYFFFSILANLFFISRISSSSSMLNIFSRISSPIKTRINVKMNPSRESLLIWAKSRSKNIPWIIISVEVIIENTKVDNIFFGNLFFIYKTSSTFARIFAFPEDGKARTALHLRQRTFVEAFPKIV